MNASDCRPFQKFLHLSSLKNATVFMGGAKQKVEEVQLNTILCCTYRHPNNRSKPTSSNVLSEMYKMAQLTIKEREQFWGYIDEEERTPKTIPVCGNLLRTTIFERELIENAGNDKNALKYYLDTFKRRFFQKRDFITRQKCSNLIDTADVSSHFDHSCLTSALQNNVDEFGVDKPETEKAPSEKIRVGKVLINLQRRELY